MKVIATAIAVTGLSICYASAVLDPGAAAVAPLVPAPPFLLLAQSGNGGSSPGTLSTPLPFSVVAGDLVLLEGAAGGTTPNNWSEVVRFENLNGHGLATLYFLQDFTDFALDPDNTGNIKYITENSEGPATSYTPGIPVSPMFTFAQTQFSSLAVPSAVASITYNIASPSPVPEPSTYLAGVLLLLPLGLSTIRRLRQNRTT